MSNDESMDELFGEGSGLLDRILDRLRAGEPLDIPALEAEFPDQVEEIPRLVQLVGFVHGAAQGIHPLRDLEARIAMGEAPRIDGLQLKRLVARGGMGLVFEAEDPELGRRVALKMLSAGPGTHPREHERFRREARNASRLNHPNIVPIFGVGDFEGVPYYSMPFIEGESLAQFARKLPGASVQGQANRPHQVARWGSQVAGALSHAHRGGIVHRDVKPSNILIDGAGDAHVTDFGLARRLEDATLTRSGDLLGTLRYMSPEQARGGSALDERTDLYSLGATLYELLAEKPMFDGEGREEILRMVLLEEPAPLGAVAPGVPRDLATIVHKAIAKEPEERYASAELMKEDLDRFLAGRAILARPPSWIEQLRSLDRRHRTPLRLGLLAMALLLLLTTVVSLQALRISVDRDRILDESTRALRVQEFLADMLFYANPKGRHRASDFDALLDRVSQGLTDEFEGDPTTEADLRFRLGDVLWTRSRLLDADEELQLAVSRGREAFGAGHPFVTRASLYRASLLHFLGQYQDCLDLLEDLEGAGASGEAGPELLALRGKALVGLGEPARGIESMRASLAASLQLKGPDHMDTALAYGELSTLLVDVDDPLGAIDAQRRAAEIHVDQLGEQDQLTLISRCYLAARLLNAQESGAWEEARGILNKTIDTMRVAPTLPHVDLAWATGLLARTEWKLGNPGRAEAHFVEALGILRPRLGKHVQVAQTLGSYGGFLVEQGRFGEATQVLEEAFHMNRELLGESNPTTRETGQRLGLAREGLQAER